MRSIMTRILCAAVAGGALASCTVGGVDDGGGTVAAPTALTVSTVNGGAHLTWADNATDETEYMVMRMAGAADYEVIATLPVDAALYHDADVTASVTYMYMVMVMNASSEAESDEVLFTLP